MTKKKLLAIIAAALAAIAVAAAVLLSGRQAAPQTGARFVISDVTQRGHGVWI